MAGPHGPRHPPDWRGAVPSGHKPHTGPPGAGPSGPAGARVTSPEVSAPWLAAVGVYGKSVPPKPAMEESPPRQRKGCTFEAVGLPGFSRAGASPAVPARLPCPFRSGGAAGSPGPRRGAGRARAGRGPGWAVSRSGAAPGRISLQCPRRLRSGEPFATSTGTSVHGWTRPDPAGSGLAGGGPGSVSRGRTGPRPRVPEARGPTGPGVGTMMPGETHSAAPGTAADLSRCQGCASLQQVRASPGRARGWGSGAAAGAPSSPPAPLYCGCLGKRLLCFIRARSPGILCQDAVVVRGARASAGGPSFTYPAPGLPGVTLRSTGDGPNAGEAAPLCDLFYCRGSS